MLTFACSLEIKEFFNKLFEIGNQYVISYVVFFNNSDIKCWNFLGDFRKLQETDTIFLLSTGCIVGLFMRLNFFKLFRHLH
jgi:hypothetical protein